MWSFSMDFYWFCWSFERSVLSVLALQRPVDIKNRPRIPIPDEDPYSVAGVSSSVGPSELMQSERDSREQIYMQSTSYQQRRAERPPKLPPRENLYGHDIPKVIICINIYIFFVIPFMKFVGGNVQKFANYRGNVFRRIFVSVRSPITMTSRMITRER